MLFGMASITDMATGDTSNYIVENQATEIAATSPTPVAQPAAPLAAPTFGGWPIMAVLAAGAGAWYWWWEYKHGHTA